MKVVKDAENPIQPEIFEQAILDIAKGFRSFEKSRLTKRAIILLIQDAAGPGHVSRQQVSAVLEAAANLDKSFLKKAEK